MRALCVGKIVNTHGIKGDLKIQAYTNSPERFFDFAYIYLDEHLSEKKKFEISSCKIHKGNVLIKFKDLEDINLVEKYKNTEVYIDSEVQGYEMDEDEYLIADLIGLSVFDEVQGEVGEVVDVIKNKTQELLVIEEGEKTWYLPFVNEFVKEIDFDENKMNIKLIEGLRE